MIPFELRGRDEEERRALRAADGRHPDDDRVVLLAQTLFVIALATMLLVVAVTS